LRIPLRSPLAAPPLGAALSFTGRNDVSIEPLRVDDTFWRRIIKGELGSLRREYLITTHANDADWGLLGNAL
jgi:hypothetical protein